MNIKRVYIYSIIGLLILVAGIFIVNAVVDKTKAWHSAEDFNILIDDTEMTLQGTIGADYLICSHTYVMPTVIPNPGHSPDEIWVSVNGSEMTLYDAISTIGLCGSSPTSSYNNYNLTQGHLASEINILINDSEMSLQDAIDTGKFCTISHSSFTCYDNDTYWYDSCGVREEKEEECGVSECGAVSLCWRCDYSSSPSSRIKARTCYDRGCSGSSCYETETIEVVARETCPTGCATPKCFVPEYPWCCDSVCY